MSLVNSNNETKTISFRLGKALIDAKTLKGLVSLPSKLLALRKEVLSKREVEAVFDEYKKISEELPTEQVLNCIFDKYAITGVVDFLNWYAIPSREKVIFILDNSNYVGLFSKERKLLFSKLALKYEKSEKVLRACAWAAYHAADNEYLECVIELLTEKGKELNDDTYIKTAKKFKSKLLQLSDGNEAVSDSVKNYTKNNTDLDVMYNDDDFSNKIVNYYYANNEKKLVEQIKKEFRNLNKDDLAYYFVMASKALSAVDPVLEVTFCEHALEESNHERIIRASYWAFKRSADFSRSIKFIEKVIPVLEKSSNEKDKELLAKVRSLPAYGLLIESFIPKKPVKKIKPVKGRVAYILHNSFPYSSGGYATRAFGICDGLRQHGYDVVVMNRPGFPLDTKPELKESDIPESETISGFEYVRTLTPARGKGLSLHDYLTKAADALQKRFEHYKPEFVIAASNYLTAIPSLIAARRLGIPFIYEVRGFWEITRVSREPEYEQTPAFAIQVLLEGIAAKHAEYVFTLTQPMLEELINRGVNDEKISLLPNSCTPEDFSPKNRNRNLARKLHIPVDVPVIGYIGTFVQYEGLDDLAEACALLKNKGVKFRLLLVGNENTSGNDTGPITQKIIDIAEKHGFSEWLIMPGRVPHDQVENYYSLIDVAPFPRKPQQVCEMVSPMKPLEASAMKKAIVVSSVRALTEMIVDGETGLVFEKGNIQDLSTKLESLLSNKALRKKLGENGRKWVENERTWLKTTNVLHNELIKLTQGGV